MTREHLPKNRGKPYIAKNKEERESEEAIAGVYTGTSFSIASQSTGVQRELVNSQWKAMNASRKPIDNETLMSNNTNLTNTGESKMRRVVTVNVFDDSKGLPVELSLVASFVGVPTEDDNATVIREILMDGSDYEPDGLGMGELLDLHNQVRKNAVDEDILNRTGNKVKLRAVKLKDLRFNVV